ncbi:MAG: hotdog fold thioesterase [Bacteriovoracaceae bacterium]|jgi:1,4-dihydroxy-2-naphthoyl-CoA hydrolase|nr:esterase [Halobacteriovoraceae bacterium]MDP7319389.1 hotdog fold thioesterase [Bacteriovoracaceae bacterium]|tara:strand:- start:714 stop:1142 length:429 start_codon:yes stop_codon:yes gene_type:complete
MTIWFKDYSLTEINQKNKNSMVDHCGIEIVEIGEDFLVGTMPADSRTHQPFGIVHGGANCVLAETLGSIASNLICDPKSHHGVGLNINTNHLKAVRNGNIKGVAKPIHIGRTTHVWDIKTYNQNDQLTSSTTLTMAIVKKLN